MNDAFYAIDMDCQQRVAVIGMGYVGAVSAAALAARNCHVTGVEINAAKLALLQQGKCSVSEPLLADLLERASNAGRFVATDDLEFAVREANVVMVCVGTPSRDDGSVDLDAIDRVTDSIAAALRNTVAPRVVMIRSTVPPGTVRHRITPKLKAASRLITVCHHPEFLREGSAIKDWLNPPMIVWGVDETRRREVQLARETIEMLYDGIEAPRIAMTTTESELMKYACNMFHATKIDFANEVGALAASFGADPHRVMDALCHDQKLNISPAYLRPGFAFGGSCLPKDTRAMCAQAREHGMSLPLVESLLRSNQAHLKRQVDRVLSCGRVPTLLVGLTFKAGTDDLRESPMVELAEQLLGKGVPLRIYDADLPADVDGQLVGANARYMQEHLPHLSSLLVGNLDEAVVDAQHIVLAKRVDAEINVAGKMVTDLVSGPAVDVHVLATVSGKPENTTISLAA